MSIFAKVPVMASKPVASTMTSASKCESDVLIPVSSIDSMGVLRTLTSLTLGRLNVWK